MRLVADTKTCSKCKAEKNLDAFSTNRAMTDGKSIYCRVCLSEADKARRKKMAESPRPPAKEKQPENPFKCLPVSFSFPFHRWS